MTPANRTNERCDCSLSWVDVAVELVHVVGCVARLTEEWVDHHTTRAALEDHLGLTLDGCIVVSGQCDGGVDIRPFVLVTEQGEDGCGGREVLQLNGLLGCDAQLNANASTSLDATLKAFLQDAVLGRLVVCDLEKP